MNRLKNDKKLYLEAAQSLAGTVNYIFGLADLLANRFN